MLPSLSLSQRIVATVVSVVVLSSVLTFVAMGALVVRPFGREVFNEFLDQVVFIANRVDEGEDPKRLQRELGLRIRFEPELPARVIEKLDRGVDHRGREVRFRPGARNLVVVKVNRGWVQVERDLDLDLPLQTGALWFGAIGLAMIVAALALSRAATRPLVAATDAMDRVAQGDLGHRLPEGGPPELDQLARAFNTMALRLEEMLRREKELLAGLSHDLRTPLTRVRLELELLRDGAATEARFEAIEGDLAETESLIEELLALSRAGFGVGGIHRAPLDLGAFLAEVRDRASVADHPVSVGGPGGVVAVHRGLVGRAVTNLLHNALRHTPKGTPIRLEAWPWGVVVEDQGPGVPPEALPRLFEPFFQVPGGIPGGQGLGLMIVAQVAEVHGGSVRAEARPGGGLRVILRLTGGPAPEGKVEGAAALHS